MEHRLQLLSYNILAAAYVRDEWYPRSPPEALSWSHRRELLVQRLLDSGAQVLCLQEVERDAFDFLDGRLKRAGYRGLYGQKRQGRPDGCATFFRGPGLALKSHLLFHYNDAEDGGRSSGHLALIADFELDTRTIRIANTHLRWDDKPGDRHIGHRQAAELRREQVDPDRDAAWAVCGDFNAEDGSFVLQELLRDDFRDAYAEQPQPTCNPNGKAKRIDYILHSPGLRSTPSRLTPIDDRTPLPSAVEPSDHLAIQASLRF